jgi:surface carbohydrate biosynthesis protein
MPKLFLLPLEVSNRDLNWKLLLAQKVLNHGDVALVGHHDIINKFVRLSRIPSNYIGKNLFQTAPPADQSTYDTLKKNGGKLFYLHDEGIFRGDKNNWYKCFSNLLDPSCIQSSDVVFAWSANQAYFFYSQMCQAEVFTLGHPRFNLYRDKYHPFVLSSDYKYRIQASGAILFISNFGVINTPLGISKLISSSDCCPVTSINGWAHYFAEECLGFHHFLTSICALLSETGEKIVIRPHPAEDCTLYHKIFDPNPRITIISQGDLTPLILLSKCVVQSGSCTSGLESYIAGKPVVSLCASDENAYLNPSDYTHVISNPKHLIKFIQGMESNYCYSPPRLNTTKLTSSVLSNLESDTYDEFSAVIRSGAVESTKMQIEIHVIAFVLLSSLYSFNRAVKDVLKLFSKYKRSSLAYALSQFPPLRHYSLRRKIEVLNRIFKGQPRDPLLLLNASRYSFVLRK